VIEKKVVVSEAGSNVRSEENNHWVYSLWNVAFDKGYQMGRREEASHHTDQEISQSEVLAIRKLALAIGYISHEEHEDFLVLLKRLEDHV
jgi:hypothetical protein